jgi:hypothetical protein
MTIGIFLITQSLDAPLFTTHSHGHLGETGWSDNGAGKSMVPDGPDQPGV